MIAALVPALNIAKIYGAAAARDAAPVSGDGAPPAASMVDAVSRSGDPKEVLGGPLLYTAVLLAATLFGFRSTQGGKRGLQCHFNLRI